MAMIGCIFQEALVPQWQFCGISTAVRESGCLAGDQKAACLSGCGMILADQWHRIEIVSVR